MDTKAKRMAYSGIFVALCVVMMFVGSVLELGMYASPLFAGMILMFLGNTYGRSWHFKMYLATSVLCILLVPQPEANLMLAGFFGWYPILRPTLEKLPKILSWTVKIIIFNVTIIIIEYVVITFLIPEILEWWMIALLLALSNATFIMYDILIPRLSRVMTYYAKKLRMK